MYGTVEGLSINSDITDTDIKVKNILGDLPVLEGGGASKFDSGSNVCKIKAHSEEEVMVESFNVSSIAIIFEGGEAYERAATPPPMKHTRLRRALSSV